MRYYKFVIIPLIAVVAGCSFSSEFMDRTMLSLRKGMSIQQLNKLIIDDPGIRSTGKDEPWNLSDEGLAGYGKIDVIIKLKFTPLDYQYYVFAFQDNKLIYWGFPSDFTKLDNTLLFKIGQMSAKLIHEEIE